MAARDHPHRGDIPTSKGHPLSKSSWLGFGWRGEKEVRPTARLSRSKSAGVSDQTRLLERLQAEYPRKYADGRLRTLSAA